MRLAIVYKPVECTHMTYCNPICYYHIIFGNDMNAGILMSTDFPFPCEGRARQTTLTPHRHTQIQDLHCTKTEALHSSITVLLLIKATL